MARWNKAVDESFDLSDNDDDDDDEEDDDQGHDDEDESNPDYESSTTDNGSYSSTRGKGGPSGGGSKGSFRPPGSSRSGPAGTRNSRSRKKASGKSLHQEHDHRIIESEDGCPLSHPDGEDSYYEQKRSEHITCVTDDGSTLPTLRTGHASVTLEDSSGWHLRPVPDNKTRTDSGIALVGMSGRLQDSVSNEPFWDVFGRGPGGIPRVPADRLTIEPRIDPPSKERGSSPARFGNLIQNPGLFAARLIDTSPQEQVEMDLTPKLLLETAGEALDLGSTLAKDKDSGRLLNDKDQAALKYYRCTECRSKTRFESESKQHMEKRHRWRCDYVQKSSKVVGNPGEILDRPSIHHLRSGESSTSSNMERGRSALKVARRTTKHQKIRLLSLDGGGVRGLSSLVLLERLTSITNQQADGRKPVMDLSELFSTATSTSTGGIVAFQLCKVACAETDIRQPLIPRASPGSMFPLLKQLIGLADALRHFHEVNDEGPRPAADLTDLSPSDKLDFSGWHQDMKPQNMLFSGERPENSLQRPVVIDPDTPSRFDQLVWANQQCDRKSPQDHTNPEAYPQITRESFESMMTSSSLCVAGEIDHLSILSLILNSNVGSGIYANCHGFQEAASAVLETVYHVEENRHLDGGSEPSTYLDWIKNWGREHDRTSTLRSPQHMAYRV